MKINKSAIRSKAPKLGILLSIVFVFQLSPCSAKWIPTGKLTQNRQNHTQTVLTDGRVLVAGGDGSGLLKSAEIYNPATGQWTITGNMSQGRSMHTATLLKSGKVLVVGGETSNSYSATAEIFDPATGIWTPTASMVQPRLWHTATLLNDGKVLIVGGQNGRNYNGYTVAWLSELYNPETAIWSSTPTQGPQTFSHTSNLMPDGRVLILGGDTGGGGTYTMVSSASFYNPQNGVWSSAKDMNRIRKNHSSSLLSNGKVLVSGGLSDDTPKTHETYDPTNDTWTTLEYNDLVAGGNSTTLLDANIFFISSFFNPANNTWNPVAPTNFNHQGPPLSLLKNGKVLITSHSTGETELFSYSPPIITTHPINTSSLQGRSTTLSVSTPDDFDTSFQWKKNGSNIDSATSQHLKLNNLQAADAGEYTVTLKNSAGITDSNPAVVSVIPDLDGDGLSDSDETNAYNTDPSISDSDGDGLSDGEEVLKHMTNPLAKDTDGDGFDDKYELESGNSPSNPDDKPLLVAKAYPAIEFVFPSSIGSRYKIEGSSDLITWNIVETGVNGTGSAITRFYPTRYSRARFFRVTEDTDP